MTVVTKVAMNLPLSDFFEKAFQSGDYPHTRYRAGQTSLCMFGGINGNGMVQWRPVRRSGSYVDALAQFEGAKFFQVAQNLDSGFWCSTLDCWWGYKSVVLDCGAWNSVAYQAKQTALREHFDRQRSANHPVSLPFCHSPSGSGCQYAFQFQTGEVWTEEEDGQPISCAAESLSEFFAELRYDPIDSHLVNAVFD